MNKVLLISLCFFITFDEIDAKEAYNFTSNDGSYEVQISKFEAIQMNTFVDLEFTIDCLKVAKCDIDNIHISASMPHHGHGLKYKPLIKNNSDNKFLIKGLKFHMSGYWEIYIDIQGDGNIERSQFSIRL